MESQGVQIRRASTTEVVTLSSVLSFSTSQVLSSDTAVVDFVDLGYTSAMNILSNGTNNTAVYNVSAVSASAITLYQPSTVDASTAIQITGQTMAEIAEMTGISGPSQSNSEIDITSLQSTAKEFIPGLLDNGQVTLEGLLNFDATAQQTNMMSDQQERGLRSFDIRFTDEGATAGDQPSFYYFDAYVVNFAPAVTVDDAAKVSMTLKVTGEVRLIAKT
jgi:hypothetical protein